MTRCPSCSPISNIRMSEVDVDQDVVKITPQPSFPLIRGITMKRGQGALQEHQMQSKVGIMVCKRCFNAIIQQCGLLCRGSKRIFKCNVQHFYKELLVHNLPFQSDTRNWKCACKIQYTVICQARFWCISVQSRIFLILDNLELLWRSK